MVISGPCWLRPKFKWVDCKLENSEMGEFLHGLKLIQSWGSKVIKPLVFSSCRSVPSRLKVTQMLRGSRVSYSAECFSFSSSFHFSDIKDIQLSVGPCSAVFLLLPVHGQTCSVIGFYLLHHKPLRLGSLQPCQISTGFHHPSPLTTLNRAPCCSPYEALAPPFHNEAVKKRGAD